MGSFTHALSGVSLLIELSEKPVPNRPAARKWKRRSTLETGGGYVHKK